MSAVCFNLDESKILSSGNGLILTCSLSEILLKGGMDLMPPNCNLTPYSIDSHFDTSTIDNF